MCLNRYISYRALYFSNFNLHMWGIPILNLKTFHQEYVPSSHSTIGRNNQNVTKAIESPADGQRNKNTLLGAIRLRPVKLYLKMPALGFLQKQMKSLHRACIPGIINSFWLILFKKVYSCIQNTSS